MARLGLTKMVRNFPVPQEEAHPLQVPSSRRRCCHLRALPLARSLLGSLGFHGRRGEHARLLVSPSPGATANQRLPWSTSELRTRAPVSHVSIHESTNTSPLDARPDREGNHKVLVSECESGNKARNGICTFSSLHARGVSGPSVLLPMAGSAARVSLVPSQLSPRSGGSGPTWTLHTALVQDSLGKAARAEGGGSFHRHGKAGSGKERGFA